jgi:hypothetical protein
MEDTDAAIVIVKTGVNPALRRVSRAHGVSLAGHNEVFSQPSLASS